MQYMLHYGGCDSPAPLRGAIWGLPIGGPRMSPRPRVAKYGATHSCNPSRCSGNVRLWSSSDAPHRVGAPRMSPRPRDLSINTLMRTVVLSPRPCDLSINTLPWTVVPTPRGEIRSSSPPRAEGRSLRCARFGGISRCCDAEHRTLLATYASNGANGANGRYGGGADT